MHAAECNTAGVTVTEALRRVPDPRQRRGCRYAWASLLLVICAAVVSEQQKGAATEQWIGEHPAEWQAWMPTARSRIPSPATVRRALRQAEVAQLFKAGRQLVIAGCRVTDGKITRGSQARVQRKGQVVYTGEIQSLRRGKDDVREVATGFECGITLEDFNAMEVGDIIETFSKVRV